TSTEPDRQAFVWELQHMSYSDGTFDGRSNDWWRYISNPNYQTGRGQPMTKPVKGPFQGGLDFTVQITPSNLHLSWRTEVTGLGTYEVQKSTNRTTWSVVQTGLSGTTASFDTSRPSSGVDTFYRVSWNDGTTTRFSDQLGVNLGSSTPVNVQNGVV